MQTFDDSQSQNDAAQVRITTNQLLQALKTIETQLAAQADTLTIGEAIQDMNLNVTPEHLLAIVQSQSPAVSVTASTEKQARSSHRSSPRSPKLRRRLLGMATSIAALAAIAAPWIAPRLWQATRQTNLQSYNFIQAVRTGDTEFASDLLDQGFDPNTRGVSTNNPTLLGKIADPLHGRTPALTIAVARGDTRMVELLLNKGADPNIQDYLGSSPLFYLAGKRGYSPADRADLHLLLQHGAKTNFVNHRGETPRHYAQIVNNEPDLVRDLTSPPDLSDVYTVRRG